MQYGNSEIVGTRRKKNDAFKSYYVVWKRYYEKREYGVWEMFKSYYVVWKRDILKRAAHLGFAGLNRTMQYGNEKKKNTKNIKYMV